MSFKVRWINRQAELAREALQDLPGTTVTVTTSEAELAITLPQGTDPVVSAFLVGRKLAEYGLALRDVTVLRDGVTTLLGRPVVIRD